MLEQASDRTCGPAALWLTFFSRLSLIAAMQHFSLFLKYIIKEMPPALLIGSALASDGSVFEPAGMDSV